MSATVALVTVPARGQAIPVPNGSFESQVVNPQVFPIDTRIDSWQKTPKPGFFTDTPQLTWDQTVGMFNGTPTFSPTPYSNLNGNQAAYMLPIPTAGIFSDNQSTDWNNVSGGLNATYQTGLAYQFTLGIFGKEMIENFSSMQLSLYYRDAGNMITVGTPTTIVFNTSTFNPAGPFTLVDYSVTTPIVQAGDAWAGKNIGISILSATGDGNGHWDMDNVRLVAVPEPGVLSLVALGAGAFLLMRRRLRSR